MSSEYAEDTQGNLWKRVSENNSGGGCSPFGCIGILVVGVIICIAVNFFSGGKALWKFVSQATEAEEKSAHEKSASDSLTSEQRTWASANVPELYEKYTAFERSREDVVLQIELMEGDANGDAETLSLIRRTEAYSTAKDKLGRYASEIAALRKAILEHRANSLANAVSQATDADKIFAAESASENASSPPSEVCDEKAKANKPVAGTQPPLDESKPKSESSAVPASEQVNAHQASPKSVVEREKADVPASEPETPAEQNPLSIVEAFRYGNKEKVLEYLNSPRANLSDSRILIAALNSEIATAKTIRLLLERGGNANAESPETELPPLYFAVANRKPEFVKILIRAGANPNQRIFIDGEKLSIRDFAKRHDRACYREIFISGK